MWNSTHAAPWSRPYYERDSPAGPGETLSEHVSDPASIIRGHAERTEYRSLPLIWPAVKDRQQELNGPSLRECVWVGGECV
jgi:hypothetical protein